MSMQADVKGDIYEGLLSKSAAESPKGAGQYFTPRELIKAIVDCARPTAADTLCDPACGTGGFLLNAHDYVVRHQGKDLDPDQKKHLKRGFVKGWELVPNTARLCIMNLMLHGIDADPCPIVSGKDSLASPPRRRRPGESALDQSPVREEIDHLDRERRGQPGKRGRILRAARLLDMDQEQAVELPPARQEPAQDQRPLRHRRSRQRAVRGRCRRDRAAEAAGASKLTFTPCCGSPPASS